MRLIIELLKIVNENTDGLEKIFRFQIDSDRWKVFQGIRDGRVRTDEDAMSLICKDQKDIQNYDTFKSHFRQHIIEKIFTHKLWSCKRKGGFLAAQSSCEKSLFIARELQRNEVRHIDLFLREPLRIAQKFHFTDLEIEIRRILKGYFSKSNEPALFETQKTIIGKLEEKRVIEEEAKEFWQHIVLKASGKLHEHEDFVALCEKYCKKVDLWRVSFDSHRLRCYEFRIKRAKEEALKNWKGCLSLCDDFEEYLNENKQFDRPSLREMLIRTKITSARYRADFKLGIELSKQLNESVIPGGNNWFYLKEQELLLYLRSNRLAEASLIFDQVLNHPRRKQNPENWIERWKLYEAYIRALDIRLSESLLDTQATPEFSMQFPNLKKDKTGYWAQILPLEILLLLQDGSKEAWDAIVRKSQSLPTYKNRYIKNEKRLNALYGLIANICKNTHNLDAVERGASKHIKVLEEAPISEHEIIPYGRICNVMVNCIKKSSKMAA